MARRLYLACLYANMSVRSGSRGLRARAGAMPFRSLIDFIAGLSDLGSETAYVQRRGYRLERWSYRDVHAAASGFARELAARGIARGDHVLLWGENSAEWAAAFFGCVLGGAVVVPMDAIASSEFACRVAREADIKLAVKSGALAASGFNLPTLPLESLGDLRRTAPVTSVVEPDRTEPLEIVFTSGTTTEPKGVVISHANILANLRPLEAEIAKYRKYERPFHPIRFLNLLPLSHVFGQFLGMFVPPLIGGTVVFEDTFNPSEIVRMIRRERISVLVGVPRLFESLRHKMERDLEAVGRLERFQRDFSAASKEHFLLRWWRFRQIHKQFGWKFWALVSGGATLDRETEEFWRRLGFAVIQGYGLTETTSLLTVNHPFQLAAGSVGKILPGREIKLSAEGEILVRGESVTAGYWRGQTLLPVLDDEGWFHTGDRGELGPDGHLYFQGRLKDVIVTPEGLNVFPEDLEPVLRRDPRVRDCVVVGVERGGNAEPCAVLLLNDGETEAEAIVRRANESLAGFQHIRRWLVWPGDDFPRSAIQKPRRRAVQEWVERQSSGQPVPASSPGGSLGELIGRITGRMPANLSPQANLEKDLNLSSLDRVELLSAIEDRFQVDLNESKFAAATTLGDLEQMLRRPAEARSDYVYPRWAERWPVTWIRLGVYYLLTWPATVLLGYPRVHGRENLRGLRGPVLIVSNHVTRVDIGFILAAMPARFRHRIAVAMLGELLREMRHPPEEMGLFRRLIEQVSYALVVALFNVFPLPQRTGFRESFAYAGESIDRGYSAVVFPEGRRTDDGRLQAFRAGIGLLAEGLKVPVVPVRIDGLFELKKAGKHMARPGAVRVTIGEPVRFAPGTSPEVITHDLHARMSALEWN